MIVTNETANEAFSKINGSLHISVDTETTGLRPYHGDVLFSIIISTTSDNFYFNFKDYTAENIKSLDLSVLDDIRKCLADKTKEVFLQNAKYDMAMLAQHDIFILGKTYDLKFLDRIHNNQHARYSLDEISKRWGSEKLDIVKKYVDDNNMTEIIEYPELNKSETKLHYELVPFNIMAPYGEQDGGATLDVSLRVRAAIITEDILCSDNRPRQEQVVDNEVKLVKTLFKMEKTGVRINRDYCFDAMTKFKKSCEIAESNFKSITGIDFVKGTTVFEEVFLSEKNKWVMTSKKNWQWDKKVLSKLNNPAATHAADYSEAKKQLDYFQNFLWFADSKDTIHPVFDQSGTVTGRLSSRSPNMQNMTNPDKYEDESEASEYPVRSGIIPRDGYFFAMLDYKQIEYRVFLDIAKANGLIDLVLSGLDVHEATTKIAPVTRKEAKTVNFLTLYGGGAAKLAGMLYETTVGPEALQAIYMAKILNWRVTDEHRSICNSLFNDDLLFNKGLIEKAVNIQKSIFNAAPEIKETTKAIQKSAETRGYIFNWLGRRYQFSKKEFCYKAPNHLIQGNCADILKVAMNRVNEYLSDKESRMILSIHDELVIEVKFGEEFVIAEIKNIMENVYPYKRLPLEVDVEYSLTNLSDKNEWTGQHV